MFNFFESMSICVFFLNLSFTFLCAVSLLIITMSCQFCSTLSSVSFASQTEQIGIIIHILLCV